jgi:hypothetical protein
MAVTCFNVEVQGDIRAKYNYNHVGRLDVSCGEMFGG